MNSWGPVNSSLRSTAIVVGLGSVVVGDPSGRNFNNWVVFFGVSNILKSVAVSNLNKFGK